MNRFIKLSLTFAIFLISAHSSFGQVKTYKFAQRDTTALFLDVYQPKEAIRKNICVLYVFGGGFVTGSRQEEKNVEFFNDMANRGYTVVAIDYRLGLKGASKVGAFNPKPAFKAVEMATEDLVSATSFIIENNKTLGIDPKRIVIIGSSAGAITALQTDYELANRSALVKELPQDFHFAGVVSLAGALFSETGNPRYSSTPAPTLFYHGTKDKTVVYNKLKVFRKGMFGTKALVKIFNKGRYKYMAIKYKNMKHEVAVFPRFYMQDNICNFIDMAITGKYDNELDITIKDRKIQSKYKY
ncbi:MAG: carboxylesterase family protein [Rikenellaceae bacterium]